MNAVKLIVFYGLMGVPGLAPEAPAQPCGGWTLQATTGPSPRRDSAMAYDSDRGVTVLFGGFHSAGNSDETWEWDGTAWSRAMPSNGPGARSEHAMAYDAARHRVVLFGGVDSSGLRGDTWEWDGSDWMLRATAGPSPRGGHTIAYDDARQVTMLFGGSEIGGQAADTWEWDGSIWTERIGTGPGFRAWSRMVTDSVRHRIVLFGGSYLILKPRPSVVDLADTWEWNGTDTTWTMIVPSGGAPPGRRSHAMSYDARRHRTVLYAGTAGLFEPVLFDDTWEWDGAQWLLRGESGPGPRSGHAMAYDSEQCTSIMFGGQSPDSYLGDTWSWHVPQADWNNDLCLTSQDFFDFLGDYFAEAADFNLDGRNDSQDFFDFLTAFFTGC